MKRFIAITAIFIFSSSVAANKNQNGGRRIFNKAYNQALQQLIKQWTTKGQAL